MAVIENPPGLWSNVVGGFVCMLVGAVFGSSITWWQRRKIIPHVDIRVQRVDLQVRDRWPPYPGPVVPDDRTLRSASEAGERCIGFTGD